MAVLDLSQILSGAVDLPNPANENLNWARRNTASRPAPTPAERYGVPTAPLPGSEPLPGSLASLQASLNEHLKDIDTLQRNLASGRFPALSDTYRRLIASGSAEAQNMRARIQAAGPKLMPPTLVTQPGSGGLFNEEKYLLKRDDLPPRQQD
jgi:hypothetical protein